MGVGEVRVVGEAPPNVKRAASRADASAVEQLSNAFIARPL